MLNTLVDRPVREHPRVSAEVTVSADLNDGISVMSHARDLSMVGVFLEANVEVAEGAQVPLRIKLPEGEVQCTGKVERVCEDGVAFSFAKIEWDDLLLIAKVVAPKL